MTEREPTLSPVQDPENVDLRLVEDESDEEPGMTPDEIDDFLATPVPPIG